MGHSDAFDVIPFEDIKGDWKKLGSGSFGNVYKGNYLGIDVAIKEVLPSNEYDVSKYFEREWRLMKEARHPNVVLYLGLSRAPDPDGRIFIVSEYIDNGNLRMYIHDKSKPFPWRLRMSFATDIVRALAYLHARKCIHRDLKGENLLVTTNGRLKITDFGFARIAARNEDESKRLTFCGTDSYMSPEILLGDEFDLPTDIFSLGIILCEIAARRLADDTHFKRAAPTFGIDPAEVHQLASPGCPPAFLALCIDCLAEDPTARPTTRDILERLRDIEADVLLRPSEGDETHVGSVKFLTGGRRPGAAPRIPSFGMGVAKDVRSNSSEADSSDDEELMEAVMGLEGVGLNSEWSNGTAGHSKQPLIPTASDFSDYSTTVIRGHAPQASNALSSILDPSSVLTVKRDPILPSTNSEMTSSMLSIDTWHTAHSSMAPSIAGATEGGSVMSSTSTEQGSTIRNLPLVHRFTLIKPGAKRESVGTSAVPPAVKRTPGAGLNKSSPSLTFGTVTPGDAGWNPLDLFWASGLLVAKCDICTKRLGWKPVLECDDCGLRAHTKCGEVAPRDCGLRAARPTSHHVSASASSKKA